MWRLLLLSMVQSLLLAGGQVLLKIALARMLPFGRTRKFWGPLFATWPFLGAGICFGLGSLLWMYILREFPLSMAYPMVSISYVFGILASIVFFNEHVVAHQWLVVVLIMSGCCMVVKGEEHTQAACRQ